MSRAKPSIGARLVRAACRRQLFTSTLGPLDAEIDATLAAEVKRAIRAERRAIMAALEEALAVRSGVDAYGLRMARGIVKRRGRDTGKTRSIAPTAVEECDACGCPGDCACPCDGCRARLMMATRGT